MKIAILCASGKSGRCVLEAALRANLEIVAFVRNRAKADFPANVKLVEKDIFALDSQDLQGFDVIVDAFAEWVNLELHIKHIKHLVQILQGNKARFIIVGGAGSLYMESSHTTSLMDTPDFPAEYLGVAKATADVLAFIRTQDSLNWLYISPAAIYDFEGAESGKYEIIGEEFKLNAQNQSYISYKDYALALIEIATNTNFESKYAKRRISLLAK